MLRTVLATKLHVPPPRPGVVSRPRLFAQLDAGARKKLTLVSAPAGFGKTTLVSEWIGERAVAWLSLDARDNDVGRFLTYVVAALQSAAPGVGAGAVEALRSAQAPAAEPLLTALVNDVAELAGDLVLVLDDYHVIETEAVDEAVAFLIEHLPAQMHVLITTREDPDLPLARLRVRDHMVEIRAADLRFTTEESAAFLNEVMDLGLSADDVAALGWRTEGWIAGLQLAALSMQGRDDASSFIRAFAGDHRYVVDYLVEEVLARQPERVRSFLLHTSVLERLCGPLCDTVTGQEGCGALLETLERGNLFLIPLDDRRRWFRYHHLFADVLRAHLADESPALVARLHARASVWYEADGALDDAVRHALAGEDFGRAAAFIEKLGPELRGSYRNATLLAWLRAIPDRVLRSRPVLSVEYARAATEVGDFQVGEARLRDAEAWLEAAASEAGQQVAGGAANEGEVPGVPATPGTTAPVARAEALRAVAAKIATARTFLAQAQGDVVGTVSHAGRALELLPPDDVFERGVIGSLLGLAHWSNGALEEAHGSLKAGLDGIRDAGNVMVAVGAQHMLADVRVAQGRLSDAMATYERALRLAAEQPEPVVLGTANLHLGWSEILFERGEREAAAWHLERSEALGEPATLPDTRYRWCLAHAERREDAGDLHGALDLLEEAERLHYPTPIPDVRPIAARKARILLLLGHVDDVMTWAQERGLSVDDEPSYLREYELMTLARASIARFVRDRREQDLRGASALLQRLLNAAEAGERTTSVIEILLLMAMAHLAGENEGGAQAALERALNLAAPEGCVRCFVREGPAMARALERLRAHGLASRASSPVASRAAAPIEEAVEAFSGARYLRRLLAAFPPSIEARTARQATALAPEDGLLEPLSDRELEVLRLIADGLSNQEIASRLFRALPTVKGYNRAIFEKLQVERRTEAVARARQLGLI
jgi:LuxR family transcriptional regulator, maltose regulon positive regulatory protein